MDDTLQKYFTGRDKRLAPLSEQDRKALLASAQESGEPQEVFIDRALVSRWMQQRTEADPAFVRENLDELVHIYFGAGDTPSSAYDKITGNYEDYSQRVAMAAVIQRVQAEQRKQSYEDRMVGSNAARSFGEGAATTTISMAEGAVRQADLLGQGPGGGIPIGMMGYGPPGMIPAEDVRRFEEKGYQPGPLSGLADQLWRAKQDVSAWFDVDPEFAKSFMGTVTSGAGSLIPQIGVSMLNPVAGMAALESQAYASATDAYWQYKGVSPDNATPEQRTEAAGAATIFAIPSMLWNRWGLDRIIGSEVRGAVTSMTKTQLLRALGRPVIVGGSAEAGSQLLDDVGQDVIARVTYAPDKTLFTADDIKRYLVDATASFVVGGTAAGGFSGTRAVMDRRNAGTTDVSAAAEKPAEVATQAVETPVPPAATETPVEAATQAVEAPVTHEGALYQPEGATSQLTEQEAALLARKNTADGVLDEQAIVELCENPEDGQLLLDAVKGDEKARDAYNDLMAERDADATPEIAEESLDDLNAQLAAAAAEPVTDEDGRTTDTAEEAQAADMKELEDAVAEELEAQGRTEGESAADMRKRARAIAWEMFSPKNDRLMTAKTARFLGIGHLSKKAERRMLRAAREQFLVAAERVYGNERVAAVRKAGWERMKERLAALRQQKDAKLSEVRADRDTKLDALRAEKNAKISEVREAGWVRLETKVFELRQRQMQRLVEANGRRARGQANKKLEARVKHWQNALKSARGGGKALRIKNADAVDAYIRQITEPPSMEDQKAANDLQEKLESEKGYDLTQEDMALMARVSMPRVGSGKLTESQALSILANLNNIIKTGKTLFDEQREAIRALNKQIAKKATDEVVLRNAELGVEATGVFGEEGLIARVSGVMADLLTIETANTIATGKEGTSVLTKATTDVARRGGNLEYDLNHATLERLNAIAKASEVDFSKENSPLVDAKGAPLKVGKFLVRLRHAMSIYAYSKSDTGMAHLVGESTEEGIRKGGTVFTGEDGKSYTLNEDIVARINDALPQRYKDFVDRVVDFLSSEEYMRVNEWFKRKYGVDMPRVENYFPIRNLENTGSAIYDMLTAAKGTWFAKGFVKARQNSTTGFRSLDFLDTLARHFTNVNHVLALDEATQQIEDVLKDRDLHAALYARNHALPDVYRKWVDSIKLGRTDPSKFKWEHTVGWLRTRTTTALLGYRLSSALKVFGSFGPGAMYVNKAMLFHTMFDTFTQRTANLRLMAERSNSAEVKARFDRYNQMMRDLTDNPQVAKMLEQKTGVSMIDPWMFMRIAEMNQTCILWTAKYREGLHNGLPESEAVKQADWVIENTQQSGQLMNLPAFHRGSPIVRAMFSFQNDVMHSANTLIRIFEESGNSRQRATRLVSYLIFNMAYVGILMAAINRADREVTDYLKDLAEGLFDLEPRRKSQLTAAQKFKNDSVRMALVQPVQAIPFIGWMAEAGIARLQGDTQMASTASDSGPIWETAGKTLSDKKYASAFGQLMGIPLTPYMGAFIDKPIAEAADRFIDDFTGSEENDEPAY